MAIAQALAVPFWLWALEQVMEEPEGKCCSRRRQSQGGEHEFVTVVVGTVVERKREGEQDM